MKEVKPNTPVLMLTAMGTTVDKVTGFNELLSAKKKEDNNFIEIKCEVQLIPKIVSLQSNS